MSVTAAAELPVVDSIQLNGQTIWKTSVIPKELIGRYLYEKKGEPIIQLNADGTGLFQAHMVPPIPIRYWLLATKTGEAVKQTGGSNYRYTIVVQYGPGGGGNYPEGSYDGMDWTWIAEQGCSNILGERLKCP
jgi:hypothetical protein